jgi:hypothetical protein
MDNSIDLSRDLPLPECEPPRLRCLDCGYVAPSDAFLTGGYNPMDPELECPQCDSPALVLSHPMMRDRGTPGGIANDPYCYRVVTDHWFNWNSGAFVRVLSCGHRKITMVSPPSSRWVKCLDCYDLKKCQEEKKKGAKIEK